MAKRATVFPILLLLISFDCSKEGGRRAGHAPPPNIDKRAYATPGEKEGEISLVTWRFSETGSINGLGVVDLDTGYEIPNHPAVVEGDLVITLELPTGLSSKPHIALGNGSDTLGYTAEVTPPFGVSTFNRRFSPQTDFVQDHGVERVLKESVDVDFTPSEYATLWVGDKFVTAARARFVNEGPSGSFILVMPQQCRGWLKKARLLAQVNFNFQLESGESVTFIVAPQTSSEPIVVSLNRVD